MHLNLLKSLRLQPSSFSCSMLSLKVIAGGLVDEFLAVIIGK